MTWWDIYEFVFLFLFDVFSMYGLVFHIICYFKASRFGRNSYPAASLLDKQVPFVLQNMKVH